MKFLIILLLSVRVAYPLVGEDTALLIELVSNTASQLNELEQLVSNTEKYTERLKKYNDLFLDEYFKAERVAYLAEEIASKKKIEDLGELNSAIRELRYSMSELKVLMKDYSVIKNTEKIIHQKSMINKNLIAQKSNRAAIQVNHSINSRNAGRSNQLTAQNTSLIHETQVQMQGTQQEILNQLATNNRLLSEDLEDKRLRQIEFENTYNLKKGRR